MTQKIIDEYTGQITASKCENHNWYANFDAECPQCGECEVCKGECRGHEFIHPKGIKNNMDYNQKLPEEVQKRLDDYIERVKAIKWFQPSPELKKEEVEKHLSVVLKAFGVEASVEYKQLKTSNDWDAARNAARNAAWDAAWDAARNAALDAAWDAARNAARNAALGAARDAAWDAAWDAARNAARNAALDAAWDAARGAADVLATDLEDYKKTYPNGSFINLIPLWEMGLYPVGVVNGKFIIYVPASKMEFPEDLK